MRQVSVALGLVAYGLVSPAQADLKVQVHSLPSSLAKLQSGVAEARQVSPENSASLAQISADGVRLRAVEQLLKGEARDDYARALAYDAALLSSLSSVPKNERADVIAQVAEDVRIKTRSATGLGIGSQLKGRVAITVATLRKGQRVGGYVITLNPVRYRAAQPFYRLASLSPNATGLVAPGRYEVAALLGGTPVHTEVVPIGLAAEESAVIELPVP